MFERTMAPVAMTCLFFASTACSGGSSTVRPEVHVASAVELCDDAAPHITNIQTDVAAGFSDSPGSLTAGLTADLGHQIGPDVAALTDLLSQQNSNPSAAAAVLNYRDAALKLHDLLVAGHTGDAVLTQAFRLDGLDHSFQAFCQHQRLASADPLSSP